MAGDYTTDVTGDLGLQPTINAWPGNNPIDTVTIAPTVLSTTYLETDVLGDPAVPLGLAPVDPLLGLGVLAPQLGEFVEVLGYVLSELQARSDLVTNALTG